MNGVDEAITVATLPAYRPVVAGEMVATVKIIPYAVPGAALERALPRRARGRCASRPTAGPGSRVVSTLLPGLKESVDKTLADLRPASRPTGAEIVAEARVPHRREAVADALPRGDDGGSRRPRRGVRRLGHRRPARRDPGRDRGGGRAGRAFRHAGRSRATCCWSALGGVPVIGAPGCARSPKENGFDWVLHRLLAGLPVTRADIVALGVGGLLMEIVSRPQPRAGGDRAEEEAWGRCPLGAHPARGRARHPLRRGAEAARSSTASRWCATRPRPALGLRARPVVVVLGAHADRGRRGARRARPRPRWRTRPTPTASPPRSRPGSRRCRRGRGARSCCSATCRG